MDEFQQTTLANLNIVRSITNSLGGGLNKNFGQNFLINQNSLLKFVKSINLSESDIVIEIGPGIGVVTYTLCQTAKKVYLVEIDKSKEPALQKVLENYSNYEIIWEDATTINFPELIEKIRTEYPDLKSENIKLIGSLPYNVSKNIIHNILIHDFDWNEASFFLQREVADNYTSVVPKAEFLSSYASIYADVTFAFGIPAEHFMPQPKVKTGVIHLKKHTKFNDIDKLKLNQLVRQGFQQPRKTILNNLKPFNVTAELIEESGLKPNLRPSELQITDWLKIYRTLYK